MQQLEQQRRKKFFHLHVKSSFCTDDIYVMLQPANALVNSMLQQQ